MIVETKPKIILQTLKPDSIGGTTGLFNAQLCSELSSRYDFVPLVLNKTLPGLSDFIGMIKFFKETGPDLIEVQGANIEALPVILAARLARKKVLMSVHGLYSDLHALNRFKRIICRYITEPLSFYMAHGVYTVCEYASNRKPVRRYSRNLMGVVYNPAPDYSMHNKENYRDEIRTELGIGPEDPVGLYVGRITYDKGATILTRALLELYADWPVNLKIIIVGDGKFRSGMESKLQTLLDRRLVFFTGIRRDVHKYYHAADFLISPSLHENHSMTILEACAAGIPALATRTGGTPEIVNHLENGLLIEPKSTVALVSGIRQMLQKRNFWNRWGNHAHQKALTRFTPELRNLKLDTIYTTLINS